MHRILVVDDHNDSASVLSRLLRGQGHTVITAHSVAGARALAAVPPPVDLLITDLDLTDGDGCDLLKDLRRLCPTLRGIAVSGHSGQPHEDRCREAGFERLLPKPMVFTELLSTINGGPAES